MGLVYSHHHYGLVVPLGVVGVGVGVGSADFNCFDDPMNLAVGLICSQSDRTALATYPNEDTRILRTSVQKCLRCIQ